MAVPKRKQSKTRGRKRRTNYNLSSTPQVETCSKTGTEHIRHRAYEVDGVLYYKGEILGQNSK